MVEGVFVVGFLVDRQREGYCRMKLLATNLSSWVPLCVLILFVLGPLFCFPIYLLVTRWAGYFSQNEIGGMNFKGAKYSSHG